MEYNITVKGREITLSHDDMAQYMNVDDMTRIDTSNIFGETVTVSAVTNRVGIMKASLEAQLATAKLNLKVFEAKFKARMRRDAALDSGFFTIKIDKDDVRVKLTEAALATSFETDSEWLEKKIAYSELEGELGMMASLYWSMQDKARKLNGFMSGVTPEEFEAELIEGKLNGITVSSDRKQKKKAASLG